jgi:small basic protein (TIGR04137 family)
MSLHPSLKIDTAGAQQRTVLTRIERIKDLMKKELWHDKHAVTGLPKTKIVKIKAAKKEKKEEVTAEGEAGATAEKAAAPAPEAKAAKAPKAK